jgi:hypothetical protein
LERGSRAGRLITPEQERIAPSIARASYAAVMLLSTSWVAIAALLAATVAGDHHGCYYSFGLCQASPTAVAALFTRGDGAAVDT